MQQTLANFTITFKLQAEEDQQWLQIWKMVNWHQRELANLQMADQQVKAMRVYPMKMLW